MTDPIEDYIASLNRAIDNKNRILGVILETAHKSGFSDQNLAALILTKDFCDLVQDIYEDDGDLPPVPVNQS